MAETEWVAVVSNNSCGKPVRIKIAYRNAAALAAGMAEQTAGGWHVVAVYEREAKTYAPEDAEYEARNQ
jgi:hypothetical protein